MFNSNVKLPEGSQQMQSKLPEVPAVADHNDPQTTAGEKLHTSGQDKL